MTRRGGVASDTMPMFELVESTRPERATGATESVNRRTTHVAENRAREHANDVTRLPSVIDVETAGRLLGLGGSAAYQLVKDGSWPTPVLRLGRRWRVLTAPLLALLGVDGLEPSAAGVTLQRSPTAPAIFRHNQGDQQ
jgi:hypothetical protein